MNINHALAVRSDFSVGESMLQIDHIVDKAKELGYESVALMDTMSLHAMVAFSNKMKKAGLKPIVGCRIRVYDFPLYRPPAKASGMKAIENRSFFIKAFALNDDGVKSLMKLLSKGYSKEYFYYHARVGLDEVLALKGVAISTGDTFNVFHHPDHEKIVRQLAAEFPTFIELVPIDTPLFDTLNNKAISLSKRIGIPSVVTYPTLYQSNGDAATLEVLGAITSNTKMDIAHRPKQFIRDFGFSEPKSLVERVKKAHTRQIKWYGANEPLIWSQGIANIERLATMCAYEFKKLPPSLPQMAENEFLTLGKKCLEGWGRRFTKPVMGYLPPKELMPTYKKRLEYELSILKKMGFSGYFLLTEDLVAWAKRNDIIVGPGRGSCFLPGHRVVCDKSGMTKAIEEFSVGDKVLAHDGSTQEVIATLEFDRDEEIMELEFSNGVRIECTKDHKFYTRNRGWVVAEELCGEDEFDDVSELAKRFEPASSPSA